MAKLDRLVDRLVDAAVDAAAERRWADVVELARDVLVLEPDNEEARRLLALSETKIGAPTHEQRVAPQLRQLTVLMCDQEDSSGFSDRHDAETVHEIDVAFHEAVHWAVERHGGKIHHHQGDGVLAYFGFPRGQEDAARRAVEAGLDLLREVKGLQARIASDLAEHLVVRIAVHTDTAVVADFEEAVRSRSAALSGRIGNLASRLQQLADDRSIIISESTYELVRDDFVTEPLGPVSLRGFSASVEAYRIDASATRLEDDRARSAPFVGRNAERTELLATWDDVKASRGGATVVVADPGVGKSRLIREIEQTVVDDGGQVLRTACAEASRAEQWHAVRRLIGAVAGLRHDDDNEVRWTKLGEALAPVVPDPARDLPLLALVVGVPADGRYVLPDLHPAALRELTLKCAVDVLVHLAAAAPTLLIVEDLHWCDPSSWELLTRLVAVSTSEPLWVLMASRQIGPAEELGARILRMGELSDDDATTLALSLTGDADVKMIVARSNGVPLYIEELAASVGRERERAVPLTLRDLFQSRLDAAGRRARQVAQVLATIGPDVEERLLDAVLARLGLTGPTSDRALHTLLDGGVVEPVPEHVEPALRFHHVLFQEAAYASQLATEREERHSCVADVLISQGTPFENPHVAGIARHLTLADRSSEAMVYFGVAIQQALSNAAYDESLQLLDAALGAAEAVPEEDRALAELNLRMWRAYTHTSRQGYASPNVLEDYERSLELCWQLRRHDHAHRHVAHTLIGLWASLAIAGQLHRTADVLSATVGLDDDPDAADLGAVLISCRGMDLLFRGDLIEAEATLLAALERYDEGPPPAGWALPNCPMVATLSTLGLCLVLRGEPERAREIAELSMKRASSLPFPMGPYSTAFAKVYRAMGLRNAGEPAAARIEALEALEIGQRYGFNEIIGTAAIHLAAIDAAAGNADAAETLVMAVDGWQATGGGAFLPCFLTEAAEAMLRLGRLDRARELLDRANALADSSGQRTHAVEMSRVRTVLDRLDGVESVDGVEAALLLADRQGAGLFAARLRDLVAQR